MSKGDSCLHPTIPKRERGRERANAATGEEGDHQHVTSTSDPRLSCPHLVQPSLGIASFFGPTSPSPPPLCVDMINGTSKLFDLSSSFTSGLPLLSSLSFLSPCMAMMMARSWQTSSGLPRVARLVAKFGYEKPSVFLTIFTQKALMLAMLLNCFI